jgi:hypothetical protein
MICLPDSQSNCRIYSSSFQGLVCTSCAQKPQEALNLLVTEGRYWALFYMPLYTLLHNFLNLLVHIINKMGLLKKSQVINTNIIFYILIALRDGRLRNCTVSSLPILTIHATFTRLSNWREVFSMCSQATWSRGYWRGTPGNWGCITSSPGSGALTCWACCLRTWRTYGGLLSPPRFVFPAPSSWDLTASSASLVWVNSSTAPRLELGTPTSFVSARYVVFNRNYNVPLRSNVTYGSKGL